MKTEIRIKMGNKIEKLIKKQIEKPESRNISVEAKILQWYSKTKDEEFAKHFGISFWSYEPPTKKNIIKKI